MPFTPFHMGPGLAIKAIGRERFSLTVFGFAQVAIDIEPLVRILRGEHALHGITHTYAGALLIGVFALFAGRFACQWLLRLWNAAIRDSHLAPLQLKPDIPWPAAASGALLGTFSHVLVDSIMHPDMRPFAPFVATNRLLDSLSVAGLHMLCILLGIGGAVALLATALWRRRSATGN